MVRYFYRSLEGVNIKRLYYFIQPTLYEDKGIEKGLKLQSNTHIEGLLVEVNLRKTKWLLFYNLSPNNSFRNAFRKKCFRKRAPVELIYRDYNKLNFGDFKTQLKQI